MKYFTFILILSLLFSCRNSETEQIEEEKLEDNFSVSGTITGAENLTIYLEALSQQGSIVVTKGTIDGSGKFSVKGNIPGMGIYQLRIGEGKDKVIPLTLVEKDQVKINTTYADYMTKPNVSGTDWAEVMNEYMAIYETITIAQPRLNDLKGKVSEEELMAEYLKIKKPLDDFAIAKMKADPGNPFNIVLSTSASPTSGFENWDVKNLEVLKLVSEAYNKKYKDSPMAATMENQVYQIESAYNEFIGGKTSTGVAPEIALKTPAGKILKLSSLRGKVVLIDFWASWCGPCRKESPNVVRLYNQYKDKGFTVYSVSLDEDANAWKQAIQQDGLIWPNHVSDLMGWKTPMTQLYGFQSIPHTVLIGKDGQIIGSGLRGESLEQKLKEIFSK